VVDLYDLLRSFRPQPRLDEPKAITATAAPSRRLIRSRKLRAVTRALTAFIEGGFSPVSTQS
jgi:hypothetical protein